MKTNYINTAKLLVCGLAVTAVTTACDDYLDVTPPSDVTDAQYLKTEAQLSAYVLKYYADYSSYNATSDDKGGMLPSPIGTGGESPLKDDINTDNEVGKTNFSSRFIAGHDGAMQVGQTGGKWNFSNIYSWNYFINLVKPRVEAGEVSGNSENINHYLGEAYFLRALEYYYRLRKLGDFPIIYSVLPDDKTKLTEESKRRPRNEVARFIIANLDTAVTLLKETPPDGGKTRISRDVASLLKARVALFEGTWLKHHAGTPLVPNGPGWPGKDKSYNADYQYPTGSVEAESDYFLQTAKDAAKTVADKHQLTPNNKQVIRDAEASGYTNNEYYDMFSSEDPTGYDEVLMCRLYKHNVQVHWFNQYIQNGGGNFGYTKGLEKSFLTTDGMPWYASSEYAGDNTINDTKTNRDYRWQLFMKAPGEKAYTNSTLTYATPANVYGTDGKQSNSTGYIHGKGLSLDVNNAVTNFGDDATAYVIFRAAEAYLIYMEADCELNDGNSIDETSKQYWRALRNRAGVDPDFMKTVSNTDMSKEAENDWGAYSHGELVTPLLYNIRRERRCEFIGEGYRFDDLVRWRALDQLNGTRVYGSRIPDTSIYVQGDKNLLDGAVVLDSDGYIDILQGSAYKSGLFFTEAHYLDPINVQHFLITAPDGATVGDSPIYQNPGWPIENGATAEVK